MSSLYISKGLSLDNLKTIHRWLINDYDFERKNGLLPYFMLLVKYKDECWGLFHEVNGNCICIGFALLFEDNNNLHIDLFSIDNEFRNCGWGKRFILTLIDSINPKDKVTVNSLPSAVNFWQKVGFVCQDKTKTGNFKMIRHEIPKYEKIPIHL